MIVWKAGLNVLHIRQINSTSEIDAIALIRFDSYNQQPICCEVYRPQGELSLRIHKRQGLGKAFIQRWIHYRVKEKMILNYAMKSKRIENCKEKKILVGTSSCRLILFANERLLLFLQKAESKSMQSPITDAFFEFIQLLDPLILRKSTFNTKPRLHQYSQQFEIIYLWPNKTKRFVLRFAVAQSIRHICK